MLTKNVILPFPNDHRQFMFLLLSIKNVRIVYHKRKKCHSNPRPLDMPTRTPNF